MIYQPRRCLETPSDTAPNSVRIFLLYQVCCRLRGRQFAHGGSIHQIAFQLRCICLTTSVMALDFEEEIAQRCKNKNLKYQYKVNISITILILKFSLIEMFTYKSQKKRDKILDNIYHQLLTCVTPIRQADLLTGTKSTNLKNALKTVEHFNTFLKLTTLPLGEVIS